METMNPMKGDECGLVSSKLMNVVWYHLVSSNLDDLDDSSLLKISIQCSHQLM